MANFAVFLKFRGLLSSSKVHQMSHIFQYYSTLWQATKTLKSSCHLKVSRFKPFTMEPKREQQYFFSDFQTYVTC